ncbi:hypothetical protein HYV10_00160 [Candidatus Dependentiae bacterium]|nr:hypothetical protein [Candidatus Dependentiae bacterium]
MIFIILISFLSYSTIVHSSDLKESESPPEIVITQPNSPMNQLPLNLLRSDNPSNLLAYGTYEQNQNNQTQRNNLNTRENQNSVHKTFLKCLCACTCTVSVVAGITTIIAKYT